MASLNSIKAKGKKYDDYNFLEAKDMIPYFTKTLPENDSIYKRIIPKLRIEEISKEEMRRRTGGEGLAYTDGEKIVLTKYPIDFFFKLKEDDKDEQELVTLKKLNDLIYNSMAIHEIAHNRVEDPVSQVVRFGIEKVYNEINEMAMKYRTSDPKVFEAEYLKNLPRWKKEVSAKIKSSISQYNIGMNEEELEKYFEFYLLEDQKMSFMARSFQNTIVDIFIENEIHLYAHNKEESKNIYKGLELMRRHVILKGMDKYVEQLELYPEKIDKINFLRVVMQIYIDPRYREEFTISKKYSKLFKNEIWEGFCEIKIKDGITVKEALNELYQKSDLMANYNFDENGIISFKIKNGVYSQLFNYYAARIVEVFAETPDLSKSLDKQKENKEEKEKRQQEEQEKDQNQDQSQEKDQNQDQDKNQDQNQEQNGDDKEQNGEKQDGKDKNQDNKKDEKNKDNKQDKKENGEDQDGEKQDGQDQNGEDQDGEDQDGEKQDGEKQDGEKQDQDGQDQDGEDQDGQGEKSQDGQGKDGQEGQDGQSQNSQGQGKDGQGKGQDSQGQNSQGQGQDSQSNSSQNNPSNEKGGNSPKSNSNNSTQKGQNNNSSNDTEGTEQTEKAQKTIDDIKSSIKEKSTQEMVIESNDDLTNQVSKAIEEIANKIDQINNDILQKQQGKSIKEKEKENKKNDKPVKSEPLNENDKQVLKNIEDNILVTEQNLGDKIPDLTAKKMIKDIERKHKSLIRSFEKKIEDKLTKFDQVVQSNKKGDTKNMVSNFMKGKKLKDLYVTSSLQLRINTLLDASGSMGANISGNSSRMDVMKESMILMKIILEKIEGVLLNIYNFDTSYNGDILNKIQNFNDIKVEDINKINKEKIKGMKNLLGLRDNGGTPLHPTLIKTIQLLKEEQRESVNSSSSILFVFSDGEDGSHGYEQTAKKLVESLKQDNSVIVKFVGIQNTALAKYFGKEDFVKVESIEDFLNFFYAEISNIVDMAIDNMDTKVSKHKYQGLGM